MTDSPYWPEVEALLRAPNRTALPRIRELTRAEIEGAAEDVFLIYEAKYLNMDTGSMIDRDLLTMRRDRETMLRAIGAAAPAGLATQYLARDLVGACDHPTFEGHAQLEASLRGYFGV